MDKPVNVVNHFVALSPLANVQFILNCYALALTALNIQNSLVVVPDVLGPPHPIEEEAIKINSNFMRDIQTFKQLTINKVNVHVVSAKVAGTNLHFLIGYNEPH